MLLYIAMYSHMYSISMLSPGCPNYPANAIQMGWATWAVWVSVRVYVAAFLWWQEGPNPGWNLCSQWKEIILYGEGGVEWCDVRQIHFRGKSNTTFPQIIPCLWLIPCLYSFSYWHTTDWIKPSGVIKWIYVNPYIPTQTTLQNCGHLQSPGWQPTLCVAWCLLWWFASIEKSMVTQDTACPFKDGVIKQHAT